MRAPRRRPRETGIYDVNMTPLIDVSLVLVVILMVATPMAFQSSIRVSTAATAGRTAQEATRTDRIEITVLPQGELRVNRNVIPRASLAGTLAPLLAASTTRLVVVRCEDSVTHGDFVGVIDEAKTLGASQIAVMGS